MDDLPATARPPRRWLGIILFAIFTPLAIFLFLWFGGSPRLPGGPIRMVRGEDGHFVPERAADKGGARFEAQAGKIEAQDNFTSSSVSSHPNSSGFACSRICVVNHSDHLLMERAGAALVEQLQPLAYVREINYYPAGSAPEAGGLAPDITVTLDLETLKESAGPLSRTLEGTIVVSAGNSPPGLRSHYFDHLSPPAVSLDWTGRLEHRSTTTGLESSSAKYKLAAEHVAKQIATALGKEFDTRREKEGVMPDLPKAFYPPYRKPPDLPLAEFGEAEQVCSWHGLMAHNETLWRLSIDRSPTDRIAEMRKRLEAAGWKTHGSSKESNRIHVRMNRDEAVLIIYGPGSPGASATSSDARTPQSTGEPSHREALYIHFVDHMTATELSAAIDGAIVGGSPAETLLLFESRWSPEQSQRILKTLESRPPQTPQAALALARLYHRLKRDGDARAALSQARALVCTVPDPGDSQTQVRNLAKDLGDEKLAAKPIDPEELLKLGFVELKPGAAIPPREMGLEERAHFFLRTPAGKLKTFSVRVVKSVPSGKQAGQGPSYEVAHVATEEGTRSWGKGGTTAAVNLDGRQAATFSIERLGDKERFRLASQVPGR